MGSLGKRLLVGVRDVERKERREEGRRGSDERLGTR